MTAQVVPVTDSPQPEALRSGHRCSAIASLWSHKTLLYVSFRLQIQVYSSTPVSWLGPTLYLLPSEELGESLLYIGWRQKASQPVNYGNRHGIHELFVSSRRGMATPRISLK
jgi:hypothetical protein